jgi:hypothetical protein
MNGVFGGPGDNIDGPSGGRSGGGSRGFADKASADIADPPRGYRFDPGRPGKTEAGRGSDTPLTWQQRALQLLSKLQTAKGFKDLPPKLRNEVSALINDPPNDAYS